jgi:hypothetical protein
MTEKFEEVKEEVSDFTEKAQGKTEEGKKNAKTART